MRRSLPAVALALAVAVGLAVPAATPVRAAGAGAKVVIIVGATHGATESYRDRADQAYAEAIKHTPNVVKVYSPNATWSKVKAATVGASIVIYFGHGNGWPSPYTYDPKYTTKDGFGLNATAGNGDYNNKYYGEPSVATLDLAPNAIVMLHHLCYASGNSEPGDAQPSVSVAKQRIDNYGAGFLRSNAQVVLADGHTGPAWYLRQIFTTNQSIEQVWRNHPGANGHVSSFNSSRTSGAKAFMDPETPTSGFYRSLIGDPDLTTTEIAGGFAVPGRAAAEAAGAPLYDAPPADVTAAPSTVLPADTRLTILERVSGTGEDAVFRVEGLDDDSITGYAIARDLDPKDSLAPRLNGLSGSGGKAYSTRPTGGTHTVSGALTEPADWTITIKRGSTTYASKSGTGTSFSMTWDPVAAGDGDGAYDVRVTAVDAWANAMSSPGTFTIDSTPPTGAISLDDGAGSAVVGIVRAGLQGTDALSGVAVVRLANVADLDGAGVLASGTTFDRAESIAWTLSPGTGDRRVYAQWRDVAGNWSEVESDVIAVDPPDTTFTPLTPVRLLDTRAPVPSGVAKLKSSVPLRFQVAGRGGVPGDAIAVTGNLTVVGQTASGYVTLGPIVGPSPSTSTINIPKGDVRANGVVVALDRSGRLEAVYKAAAGATTHLVLDVTGYFTAGDGGSRYTSLTPARFLDTRAAGGPTAGAPLADGVPQAVVLGGRTAGGASIPGDAVAITGNLTVTGQTRGGYLSITPTSQPSPATSTLNFPTGDTRANVVTVPLGDDGRAWVVYRGSGTAHAVLDVTGYYRDGGDGLRFVPLAPIRVLDSRANLGKSGAFVANTPASTLLEGRGGVPDGADAITGNLTVTKQTRGGYVSMTPTPDATPATSTLNFPLGDTRANGVVSRVDPATGKASLVYIAGGSPSTHLVLDVTGYYH